MSDAAAFPRDDRAWPRGAFAFSVVAGLSALMGSAALVSSARSVGRAVELAVLFAVVACVSGVAFVDAVRPWLRGEQVPPRTRLVQPVLAALVLLAFAGGAVLGATVFCGYLAGVFLVNASTIRFARVNRALVDEGETRLARERSREGNRARNREQDPGSSAAAPGDSWEQTLWRPAKRVPEVGRTLLAAIAGQRERWLAWVAATAVVGVVCLGLGASAAQALGLTLWGLVSMVWVGWRLLLLRLALRDFEKAQTEPRQAFVVLVADPNPRLPRPLLGVWGAEPLHAEGRLPPAEEVYRCDPDQVSMLSQQGSVVVHEAWLDTGPGSRARPRWVASDAGIALPHRRSLFGPWYLGSIIGAERPARARRLTMPAPNPTTENATGTVDTVVREQTTGTDQLLRLFAWRLAGLAAFAGVFAWAVRTG